MTGHGGWVQKSVNPHLTGHWKPMIGHSLMTGHSPLFSILFFENFFDSKLKPDAGGPCSKARERSYKTTNLGFGWSLWSLPFSPLSYICRVPGCLALACFWSFCWIFISCLVHLKLFEHELPVASASLYNSLTIHRRYYFITNKPSLAWNWQSTTKCRSPRPYLWVFYL